MKRYKLIEVVQNGATSEPADVETWGDKQHVTRINELAADGWSIYTIRAHGEALYVYLEKNSSENSPSSNKPTIGFTKNDNCEKGDEQ